jgi:hypothetical protein
MILLECFGQLPAAKLQPGATPTAAAALQSANRSRHGSADFRQIDPQPSQQRKARLRLLPFRVLLRSARR